MQSLLGALLAAGYASSIGNAIAASPEKDMVTTAVQQELTASFSSAAVVAEHTSPENATKIIAGAKQGFIHGADWAYLAGILAVVVGAVVVFVMFPRKDDERRQLWEYHEEDQPAYTGGR